MMKQLFFFAIIIQLAFSYTNCNILSLSGGGSFGAVEAGILKSLITKGQINSTFDIITGISAGGLNAGFLSYKTNTKDSVDDLITIYSELTTDRIYQKNKIQNIYNTWGYYDTSPLDETITSILSDIESIETRPVTLIGSSNLNTQKLDIFRYDLSDFEAQVDILMATSAIPYLFPPKIIDKNIYVDGGAIDNEIIYEAMIYKNCDRYNFTFISANDKSTQSKEINSYRDYLKGVANMVKNTYNYELASFNNITCSIPKGNMKICFPNGDILKNYDMLDFDNGQELVNIGMNNYFCSDQPFC
jgi:predicted acylesterase/phospholipase RssA